MRQISANGLMLPALGQGGWNIGDHEHSAREEISAIRRGVELGLNMIDTAEMYGDGRSERLICRALAGINRREYLLVSKVYPHNAGQENIFNSCEASLKRLGTDYLDLYLLHWRGAVPLEETVDCMERLVSQGKIRRWGVSNFDVRDMEQLWRIPGGQNCAANQVLYHLGSRGIEFDLIPWLARHGLAVMAYCPLAQAGRLARMGQDLRGAPVLAQIAAKYEITVMQLLLAFVLKQPALTAIPKAGKAGHVEQNAAVLGLEISQQDWQEIDRIFWPPTSKMHLDVE